MLVGLIPAAGYARRLGERVGSKEMISVGHRPVLDHLLDRMSFVNPDAIRVVTRPDKTDVIDHVRSLGITVVCGRPGSVSESLMLGAEGLAPSDEVIFGFPDTLWEPVDGFARLLGKLRGGADVSLGLFHSDAWQRSDVVTVDAFSDRVLRIDVKPEAAETDLIWGCAATRARIIPELGENPEPGVCFSRLAALGRVTSTVLSSNWLDIGTPESLPLAGEMYG